MKSLLTRLDHLLKVSHADRRRYLKSFILRTGSRAWTEVACRLRQPPGKVFFDHLPKCGGTSLQYYLEGQYTARRTYSIDWPDYEGDINRFKSFPEAKRHAYDLVKGHHAIQLIDDVSPAMFKFTVLREPVDRVISHYYYAKREPRHHLYQKLNTENISLMKYVSDTITPEVGNWYVAHFSGLSAEAVAQDPESALRIALDVLTDKFDLVGVLEDFADFPRRLQIGAKFAKPYAGERRNVTRARPKLVDMEPQLLELIRTKNAADISLYKCLAESAR